ncbi:DUF4214 domain-containing protein [Duganella sp. BuS-21]|uniref:DUF4214 domain-containing protein n=1 Tax=Duganella sp. BuS-21 TaxID=2943848 RepID=UPI0035A70065
MANIVINLSSNLVNLLDNAGGGTTLGEDIGEFFRADYAFSNYYENYSSYALNGSNLSVSFADGAMLQYGGLVLPNLGAPSGVAGVSHMEEYVPSAYRLTMDGQLSYDYTTAGGLQLSSNGGNIYSATIQTLLPASSPYYDATLGNASMTVQGNVTVTGDGKIGGVVTSITGHADRTLLSSTLTGNFYLDGDYTSIGEGWTTMSVQGIASSYVQRYSDGSSVVMNKLGAPVTGNTSVISALLADGNNFAGNDVVNINLGGAPSVDLVISSDDGNDNVTLKGGGGHLHANTGNGNDIIILADSGHRVEGGAGNDTVIFAGSAADYTIVRNGGSYSVSLNGGGANTLSGVERLQFGDTMVGLDINGLGGQAYRLYQAAFNRVPDQAGLGYWIDAMDKGVSLIDVAGSFMGSKEFADQYGVNQSNAQFLNSLYQNVLHRAGDTAGFDWWLGHLDKGDVSRAQVLAGFGESTENQAALIGVIGNGFAYTEFIG